jgi:hypothetical protein
LLATAKLQYLLNKSLIDNLFSGKTPPEDVPGKTTLVTLQAANLIFNNLDEDHIIENCELGW